MNYQGGLTEARQQFYKDLAVDKDYIEYRDKSKDYRSVVAGQNNFMLEKDIIITTINCNLIPNSLLLQEF